MHYAVHCVFVMFLLFTLQPLGCRSAHKGSSKGSYDKLERHLRRKTGSRDVHVNMAEIRRLHQAFGGPLNLEYDPQLIEAVNDFIELDELPLVNAHCNETEHRIVRRLAVSTDSCRYYINPASSLTNLELIAHYKIQAYSSVCLQRYPVRLSEMRALPGRADQLLEMFFEQVLPRERNQDDQAYSASFFFRFIAKSGRPNTQKEALIGAMFVRDRVLESLQGGIPAYFSLSDYKEFLQDPCQQYREYYGPNLLNLALLDGELFPPNVMLSIYGSGGLAYVKALAKYEFCETILSPRTNFTYHTVRKLKDLGGQGPHFGDEQGQQSRGESSGTYAWSKDGDTFNFL